MTWMVTSKLFFWISSRDTGVNCDSLGTTSGIKYLNDLVNSCANSIFLYLFN